MLRFFFSRYCSGETIDIRWTRCMVDCWYCFINKWNSSSWRW